MKFFWFLVWGICLPLVSGESLTSWIKKANAPKLKKTLALAKKYPGMLTEAAGRKLVLVLPSDTVWQSKKSLYKRLEADQGLAETLIMQAAVEVPKVMKTYKDLEKYAKSNGGYLDTAAGTPIVFSNGKVYFGVLTPTGEAKKQGKALDIEKAPIVLDNASVFTINHLPDNILEI